MILTRFMFAKIRKRAVSSKDLWEKVVPYRTRDVPYRTFNVC